MKFNFVWRSLMLSQRWYTKSIAAADLPEALKAMVSHLAKLQLPAESIDLDHLVRELDDAGKQHALHSLTTAHNPVPVYFDNKNWPVGHFPLVLDRP